MMPRVQSSEGQAFYWWDDAVMYARQLAKETEIRHRVFAGAWGWTVAPVTRARLRVVP